eukprot:3938181-Rhodomonas_salina.5
MVPRQARQQRCTRQCAPAASEEGGAEEEVQGGRQGRCWVSALPALTPAGRSTRQRPIVVLGPRRVDALRLSRLRLSRAAGRYRRRWGLAGWRGVLLVLGRRGRELVADDFAEA